MVRVHPNFLHLLVESQTRFNPPIHSQCLLIRFVASDYRTIRVVYCLSYRGLLIHHVLMGSESFEIIFIWATWTTSSDFLCLAMINDDCGEKSREYLLNPWQMRPMFGVTKMVSNRSFRTVNRSTGFKPHWSPAAKHILALPRLNKSMQIFDSSDAEGWTPHLKPFFFLLKSWGEKQKTPVWFAFASPVLPG